jgi:pimeloyl-ACP methyl ester carboxylesterase
MQKSDRFAALFITAALSVPILRHLERRFVLSPAEKQSLRDGVNDLALPFSPRPAHSADVPQGAFTSAEITLKASDGYPVDTALVLPKGKPIGLVLFIPGAGVGRDGNNPIPALREPGEPTPYQDLLEALAAKGIASVRFMQRDLLDTKVLPLDTFKDMDAALRYAQGQVPKGTPLYLISHSRGAIYVKMGVATKKYKPAGVVLIASNFSPVRGNEVQSVKIREDAATYDATLKRLEGMPNDSPETRKILDSMHVAFAWPEESRPKTTDDLRKRIAENPKVLEKAQAFFSRLARGETRPDELFNGTAAAQWADEIQLGDPAWAAAFAKTGTPTLIIQGSEDMMLGRGTEKTVAASLLPLQADVVVVPGITHMLVTAPEEKVMPATLPDAVAVWINNHR